MADVRCWMADKKKDKDISHRPTQTAQTNSDMGALCDLAKTVSRPPIPDYFEGFAMLTRELSLRPVRSTPWRENAVKDSELGVIA